MNDESKKIVKWSVFPIVILMIYWFVLSPITNKIYEEDYKHRDQATLVITKWFVDLGMPADTEMNEEARDQEGRKIHSTVRRFYTTEKSSQDIIDYYKIKAIEKGWEIESEKYDESDKIRYVNFVKQEYKLFLYYKEKTHQYVLSMGWSVK